MTQGKPSSLTSIAYNTGVISERERIIKLLEDEAFTKAFGRSKDFNAKRANLIALIKGENKKGHNGGEHTPCCNDWGCYGCEDCDCPDCVEGENK